MTVSCDEGKISFSLSLLCGETRLLERQRCHNHKKRISLSVHTIEKTTDTLLTFWVGVSHKIRTFTLGTEEGVCSTVVEASFDPSSS